MGSSVGSSPEPSNIDDEDSGLERSAEVLDRPRSKHEEDCGTQTSPAVSRCSSFSWLSDSSTLPEEDSTSSSPPPDSSSGDSPKDKSPSPVTSPKSCQKCRRKETWERLRRRQSAKGQLPIISKEIWVRRQSQLAESSSEPELANRPSRLPLGPSSSSGSSLPSPSLESRSQEMGGKSNSAPLLAGHGNSSLPNRKNYKQSRSRSEKQLPEIEASEACQWLRAAGFPQYAQMYEDLQFPIDVNGVQKDHPFLDPDSLQSLFRRLQALNRCANMKLDAPAKQARADDSDEEDQCALSENWTFQPEIRRWSRVTEVTPQKLQALQAASKEAENKQAGKEIPVIRFGSLPPGALSPDSELLAAKFRRSGSERLRDGAKAFLRRVESLKSRRRKRPIRDVTISGPQVVDMASMERRMRDMNCVDVSPPDSPMAERGSSRHLLTRPDTDSGALSDSEVPWRQHYYKDANSNHTKVLDFDSHRGGSYRERLSPSSRSTSLTSTPDSNTFRSRPFRRPPEITIFKENEAESPESSSIVIDSDSDTTGRNKGVLRWHSFQRTTVRPQSYIGQTVNSMSSGQLLVLRKLALLKLTSIMEKHCPTHRTGWNWELPKFMRKMKNPDYKDKTVFGIPLCVSLQRSGQTLPTCIQMALTWLRNNALDQVGLFRKPGVKSRIQKLKSMAETQGDEISYEGQQAFDVADMVKQYFRELPEALLTNKLSETFIAIFQHVPVALRIEAVQCALLLLPDEHREALQYLLQFLSDVAAHAPTNQMNSSNLAVCLAPSLFHWTAPPSRSSSVSPRRNNGVPDPRQLGHNKAAHDCLLALIKNHKELFNVCDELLAQCHFSYMEESVPAALEELGVEVQQDWRSYLYACQTALLKEAREKSRGWVNSSSWMGVDISYKKVGDGHPLRLWRVSTDVEAPPTELLHRVLRERQLWDSTLIKWRVVTRLEPNAEIFQYLTSSIPPIPSKDYCVLRSWRTELAKGACVIVETSVEHCEGQVLSGGVRGIVLASRYLIEPCGSGKSRIIHLSRVDTKGRTPEWYNKTYGQICALHLSKIRSSFKHTAEGPESKV
ncbi:stAR-related lipid transfer protein 13 isoform X1 [Cimex lectularius]|uniref:Rho GTPase-activating protein 7 n=1 Tax=Cimex lectularius TaxID=79782 RepID=A0A8I6SJ60_CIMLE|nr:stAR-related lipid transfer protein 13 isoform X1 [Cimex lectularius]